MGQLTGTTALVTGASTGIGVAAAQRLAAEGAHVYLTGRRKDTLDAAAETIGANATAIQGDVSDLTSLDRLWGRPPGRSGRPGRGHRSQNEKPCQQNHGLTWSHGI